MFIEPLYYHTRQSCIYHKTSCNYYNHFKIQQASKMLFSSDSENSFDDNSNDFVTVFRKTCKVTSQDGPCHMLPVVSKLSLSYLRFQKIKRQENKLVGKTSELKNTREQSEQGNLDQNVITFEASYQKTQM